MMKRLLSAVSILCVFCMLASIAYAGDVTTIDSQLQAHIKELEDYLYAKQTDLEKLNTLAEKFELTSGQRAKLMSMYCRVLLHTEQESYNLAHSEVLVLSKSSIFAEYLNELKSDFILDLETIDMYITGREAESRGDVAAAVNAYNEAFEFYDAMDRGEALSLAEWSERYDLALLYIERGKYDKAVTILTSLSEVDYKASKEYLELAKVMLDAMTTPTPALTPEPTPAPQATATPEPKEIKIVSLELTATALKNSFVALSWTSVEGASTYSVFKKRTRNESEAYVDISKKIADLTYTDSNTGSGFMYTYYAEAYNKNGVKIAESDKITIVTEMISNGPTSNKTTTPPVTAKPAVWSAWSAWSETKPAEASTRQIESKDENRETTVTKYRYNRWRYKSTITNSWYYSYAEYRGDTYGGEGSWQYNTSTTQLQIDHYSDGKPVYAGTWYNQSIVNEPVTTKVTLYRYRDQQ